MLFLRHAVSLATIAVTAAAQAPSVALANGTVVGSTASGLDSFNGIPFAEPPTGTLRLKPPQTLSSSYGTITATGTPTSCPQFITSTTPPVNESLLSTILGGLASPLMQQVTNQGEDCLTVNVVRPAGTTPDAKLPVVIYIYGGAYALGDASMYSGDTIVNQSIAMNYPVIYVSGNYRLGGFGFLAGKELQEDGSTNLGLRDQRLVMQWVAENIAAFGGDPDCVTIFGESAGSLSVYNHLLINNGDNTYNGKPLFKGAIMDSGTASQNTDVASAAPQNTYDTVVAAAGCDNQVDTLACLRGLPYNTFRNAVDSVPGFFSYAGLPLVYKPRPDPASDFFSNGPQIVGQKDLVNVPLIIGDQEDEGTLFNLFTDTNVTTTQALVDYYSTFFYPTAPREVVAGLVDTYPSDPAAGSPFGTGDANELYPQFKRNSALFGDVTFNLIRRSTLNTFTSTYPETPAWSFLGTYLDGTPFLGTLHGSDLLEIFYNKPSAEASTAIKAYYISFIYHQDPNAISTAAPLIEWPTWTNESLSMLNFSSTENTIIKDDFRSTSYDYIVANAEYLNG